MKYEVYNSLVITKDFSIVDFVSIGKKGMIPKRIIFSATEWSNVYNLAFGDVDIDGEIDDFIITNNGDRNKILATVVSVVKDYTEKFPERIIFFRGSTSERMRLYRIAISLNFVELSDQFAIYSYIDQIIQPFVAQTDADGFFVKRKNP